MFYAKAMYRGAAIIVSADEKLDYFSYTQLGLRCLKCGEEVHLRRGNFRKTHFAHFVDIGLSKECSLRVRGYSGSWSAFTLEGKGQRRKLFQEYFMNIIKNQNANFDKNIQIVKDKITFIILETITTSCFKWFDENKLNLVIEFRTLSLKNYHNNQGLQFLIASEAIDYLSIPSSRNLLEQLIYYSVYLCCQSVSYKWDALVTQSSHSMICQTIKDLLLQTNWLSAFDYLHQTTQLIYGESTKLQFKENKLIESLFKSLENYFNIDTTSKEVTYNKLNTSKLKLEKLEIKLYTLQVVAHVLGQERKQAYRYFKTIANITNIDVISNQEIVITWKFIYHQDIYSLAPHPLKFYKYLGEKIVIFLQSKQKNQHIKASFRLANWEEIEEFEKQRTEQEYLETETERQKNQERKKRRQRTIDREKSLQKEWRERMNNFGESLSIEEFLQKELVQFYDKYPEDAMIQCPICDQSLKQKNLLLHINKTHFTKAELG